MAWRRTCAKQLLDPMLTQCLPKWWPFCPGGDELILTYTVHRNYICTKFILCLALLWSRIGWFYPYPSWLLHWDWGNHAIAPMLVKYPWMIWVNWSHQSTNIWCCKTQHNKHVYMFLGIDCALLWLRFIWGCIISMEMSVKHNFNTLWWWTHKPFFMKGPPDVMMLLPHNPRHLSHIKHPRDPFLIINIKFKIWIYDKTSM